VIINLLDQWIRDFATLLWGYPMLIFLTLVGIYFSFRLKGLQFTRFFKAAQLTYKYRKGRGEGNITPLQSLFAALGGIIGNGNLAGVATAIAVGGPGSVFWLWVSSFIAMIIVYGETLLSMSHRKKSPDGTYSGGPMYYIEKLLEMRWLATLFALAMGFKALLATSTIQSNSISLAAYKSFNLNWLPQQVPHLLPISITIAFLTWLVVIGGLYSIARVLKMITPFMVIIYLFLGIVILIEYGDAFGEVLKIIISKAFTPAGASGGFAGAAVIMAIRYGVARGFYSNEAGTGSSPIMFSTAKCDSPVKQSLIGMFGVFIDTIVATLTAFIILITGVWSSGETSTALTTAAFRVPFGSYGSYIVFLASFLFGYSTLIAWCFYGEQCFVYIWGPGMRKIFRWAFCLAIIFGFIEAELLWSFADLLNASIVIINVTAVFFLIRYVVSYSFSFSPNRNVR
jgi:AGCS family alanine or glycine:cation symporter